MDLLEMPWLPLPGANFSDELRQLRRDAEFDAGRFRRLANARLSLVQLTSLARALPRDAGSWPQDAQRLRILSNGTPDLLLPVIAATAPRHGIWLEVSAAAFATHVQEALDPNSSTRQSKPDFVLMALDHRALDLAPCPGNLELAHQRVGAALDWLLELATAAQSDGASTVILQTLVPPTGALFGGFDGSLPGSRLWLIQEFNRRLRERHVSGVLLLDAANLAASIGFDRWHDAALWNLGKIPFAQSVTPIYADHLCRVVMAARGRARKCLVLDLDNTVWGGVIGDDGLAGIELGQGSPNGEAFLAVQEAALALRERGIVLAVCSKNDEATALRPFREHPEMRLREEHIAVFQANWQDKASNLRAIANRLNIGVDSLVLLDDNPVERHQVRTELPEVGVPELPDGPEHFVQALLAAGYFEAVQFTAEDRERAAQYQANLARSAPVEAGGDLRAHWASLRMVARIAPFDSLGRARIAQLINKTNQFNLTTRRRSEAQVALLEASRDSLTLQVRLEDRFGDNGMISVVICTPHEGAWLIDTWLMSCRVLGRGVEQVVLNVLVDVARRRGIPRLHGRYVPSGKNAMVREHYPALGFVAEADTPDGMEWVLDTACYQPFETQIEVQSSMG
ncbi:MAG: HAD-IIIC family phosphatase [Burkholderiales bacterium]|nr:HAD-IIIC family phosphatase [Burkholderiales bacterium]MDE1927064.1 HAD family hydrolase [Burkholderiales bacterium]